jgi:hypothetical protein
MHKKQKKDNLLTFRKGSCSLIVCVHLIIYMIFSIFLLVISRKSYIFASCKELHAGVFFTRLYKI